jgi:sialate O-acetylesterase
MKKNFLTALLSLVIVANASGQVSRPWNNKKAAVVITYDDAINEHLDNAVPLLDSLGLKATFYVTGYSASMQSRLNDWKKVAVTGHELGNHTMYHPCTGGPGREWVKPEQDLSKYSIQRMVDETRATNLLLQAMDGKTRRTFAFTCGDTKIGDSSFAPLLQKDFVAMRSVRNQMHRLNEVDLADVDCYLVNGESGEQLIEWVKKAINTNSLLVVLFHGVGGGNGLNVSLPAHRQFLQYLKQQEKDAWIAPMVEVAEYIKTAHSR